MFDTLISLLQEESERICGRALPPEMCRKILFEQGGMVSPTAQVVKTDGQKCDHYGRMIHWRGDDMNCEWYAYYYWADHWPRWAWWEFISERRGMPYKELLDVLPLKRPVDRDSVGYLSYR